MNFNGNLTRKVKITPATTTKATIFPSSLSLSSFSALATVTKNTTVTNVKATLSNTTATAKVSTASVGNYNKNTINIILIVISIKKYFILSTFTSCASFTIYSSSMPTSPHNKKITQLNYSMGICESTRTTKTSTTRTKTQAAATTAAISTSATLSRLSAHEQEKQQEQYQAPRTRASKTEITEVMLPPLTSMSSKQIQILTSRVYYIMDKDVENIQVATAATYTTDKPLSSSSSLLPPLQQPLLTRKAKAKLPAEASTTIATPIAGYLPMLATTTASKNCRKPCLSIKMPLRHLILTIMAVVVFSMEFTICASAILQQQLTTITLPNNTHLPTATTNKSTKINDNLQNSPDTSTVTTTLMTASSATSLLFPSSVSPSSAALTSSLSSPATSSVSTDSRPPLKTMESAALVEKSLPTSSLTTSSMDDSPSNIRSSLTGTVTLLHTESPEHSSLQWEEDDENGSSELSLSTSILNTYDASDLPPLSEAEQAAKDLLTKGFSIPTYLPPFPVFAVADLPAYLNTVSTTTTESPISHLRPSDVYATNSQENLLYFDNLSEHQLNGHNQNNHKLQIPKKNSSMARANVTVQVGSHAYLPCHIHRLQNKPVSWVRLRDGHIISVDQTTFIADQRFQAIFQDDKEFTWSLQIKYVQHTDEGWYECQASSEPKMSAKVYLKVIVPLTELIGDQSRFVKAGSKVALHCIVRGTLEPPQYIIWFRDKSQISEDNKMGWYTQLDRNIFGNSGDNQNTIGSLIIPFVRKMDSGNYTCQPSNSASVSVDLHVLSGEYSASAIMSAARTYTLNDYYLLLLLFLLMLLHKT
ncbi:chitinase-like protein PB1E7.04c [Lucilia cuprina]|uniref:chitinase-like protein PB1E7.04c n=1 Tax=Lucilia cuprina TaxID=7375 RepID=UPI001F054788|nr:chitinase-like protein PB1E7.04c [Lucilia cuprina]XP_046805755.1 chitinase-like protein PB1E7.04c [Lucilia cuprina]